jgi:hypothetical protein
MYALLRGSGEALPSWSLTIFHTAGTLCSPSNDCISDFLLTHPLIHVCHASADNASWLRTALNTTRTSPVTFVRLHNLTRETYNALLLSSVFWSALPASCDHVLLFQGDSVARRLDRLHDYLVYDYVGAPWHWCNQSLPFCWLGGNGGVSLRAKVAMMALTTSVTCSRWACAMSDVYVALQSSGTSQSAEKIQCSELICLLFFEKQYYYFFLSSFVHFLLLLI